MNNIEYVTMKNKKRNIYWLPSEYLNIQITLNLRNVFEFENLKINEAC